MALINCPECQKEISDKVKQCPHCGYPLIEEITEIQKVEVTSVNLNIDKRKKKRVVSIIIVVLIISLFAGIYYQYNMMQKEKEAAAALALAETTYSNNLQEALLLMLDGGSDAESLMNLTAKVWNNTIHEERDSETDKFTTRQDGNFYTDFNSSLKVLFLDTNTINTVKIIEKSQASVERIMKDLQNPPEKYKQVYSLLLELYSSYQSITGLAINPQGSLQSFTDSTMEKIDKFMELYNKVNTILPE